MRIRTIPDRWMFEAAEGRRQPDADLSDDVHDDLLDASVGDPDRCRV